MEFYCTITAVILVLVRLCDSQQLSYTVSIQFRDANNITMMCQNNNGQLVSDAVFYRNGAPYSEDTECLQAISRSPPNNGLLSVVLTASCEGYYQCGVHMTPNAILSGPVTLNAYPVLTVPPNRNIEIEITIGENATAYCPFEVSALDSFMVVWKRLLLNGVLTVISDSNTPLNEDYSIVIPSVTFGDKGVYFCTVTSIPFQNMIGGRANGPSNTFTVRRKHIPPVFTTALTFRKNTEDNYMFLINSKGTDPLLFKWFMNNNVVESQEIEVMPTDINQVVEKMSRVVVDIENIGTTGGEDTLNLTVVVSNTEMDQLFSTSHTSFIFLHEEEITADLGTEESDKLWNDIVMYSLAFLLFVSWLLIIVLIVMVVYYKLRLRQPEANTHTVPSRRDQDDDQIDCALGCIPVCPRLPMDSAEYRNPVSFILCRVASMYWDVKPSDCTLIKSLHQVLIDVLDDNSVSSQETMEYVEALRNGVREFKDRLREEHKCKRQYSHPQTNTASRMSCGSYQMLEESNNYEDEPDGDFNEADEPMPETFIHMKSIENMLTEWIDKNKTPYEEDEF